MDGVSGSETPDRTREGTGPDREVGAFFENTPHFIRDNHKITIIAPTIE